MEEKNGALSERGDSVAGFLEWGGYFGEILELNPGYQGPFRGSRGKVDLSRHHRGKSGAPIPKLRGRIPAFSVVAAGKWCLLP